MLAWGPQELKKGDRTKLWTLRIPKVGLTWTRTLFATKEFPGLAKAFSGKDNETHEKLVEGMQFLFRFIPRY